MLDLCVSVCTVYSILGAFRKCRKHRSRDFSAYIHMDVQMYLCTVPANIYIDTVYIFSTALMCGAAPSEQATHANLAKDILKPASGKKEENCELRAAETTKTKLTFMVLDEKTYIDID